MNDAYPETPKQPIKKKSGLKYLIYILIVLIATGVSLAISLWGDNLNKVINAFNGADWSWILILQSVVFLSYGVEALILLVFCRLYTRRYKFHQGLATSLIGQFYSDVTPGASGGQVMQAYTLKSQGIQVSNAASIMVMSFILYQSSLILFDVVALAVEWNTVISITVEIKEWNAVIPMWPLIIGGFLLNISVIFLLLGMSYSHHFHNFILNHVISFFGKIRLIKNPDRTRESLRVQVENFKIELKRLASNIPVMILQITFYLIILFMRYSIPYMAASAVHAQGEWFVNGFSFEGLMHASFLTSFHQMVTGLLPLPGSAGVSELFYTYLFSPFFKGEGVLNSSQILWRTATFHILLVISGFVAAFYRSRPKEPIVYANRQTFVDMQLETYDERKQSADTLFETRQISRKEIQKKIAETMGFGNKKPKTSYEEGEKPKVSRVRSNESKKPTKSTKAKKGKSKSHSDSSWEEWNI